MSIRKRRILMVCEALGGGVFAYVSQLCNDMCDDFDVYLAYAVRPQTPQNYKDIFDNRVHMIEVEGFGGSIFNPLNAYNVIKRLRVIENEVEPNIIHLHSSVSGGLGRIAFKGKRNTVIYTPHGYAHILLGKSFKSSLYGLFEKILGRTNSITLTCCESEDEVAAKLCKKTVYIETGINVEKLDASLGKIKAAKLKRFTVFTLGRACVQKQPQIFNRIAELVPEADFIWIGGGELEHLLTAPNLKVTGWMPRNEALALAKSADVFILCSLGEAIAMSLLENMFIKKLCLVSNVMGNRSVINNGINGYICSEPEEYAIRIREALVKFPDKLTYAAYQDILEIYNTSVMKNKFVKLYTNLINDQINY